MPLIIIMIALMALAGSYVSGRDDKADDFHKMCVSKYAYMPHNQVDEYCTKLLKFEKE